MNDPPTNIRAHQSQQMLEIDWPDGRVDRLGYLGIRGACPCAGCRDEWTGEPILDRSRIPADLKLAGMEHVGTYAVKFAWTDGHSSGLYSWETLRRLGDESLAAPKG